MSFWRAVSWLLAWTLVLLTAGAALSPITVQASVLNNLLLQLAVGTSGSLLIIGLLRFVRPALLTALALVGQIVLLAPGAGLGDLGSSAQATVGQPFRLITYNVLYANRDYAGSLDFLRRQAADIVILLETPPHWADALEALQDIYPHRLSCADRRACGLTMLSRLPLRDRSAGWAADGRTRVIEAVVTVGGQDLRVVGTHLSTGLKARGFSLQSRQLAGLVDHLAGSPLPTVLAGDFNMAPWTPRLRRFAEQSGLTIAASLQGTWPAPLPVPFRIPIDHVMTSPGIRVIDRTVGPAVGSDHYPVIATLQATGG